MKNFIQILFLALAIPFAAASGPSPAVQPVAPEAGTCDVTEPEAPQSSCLLICGPCENAGGICVHTNHGCFCE